MAQERFRHDFGKYQPRPGAPRTIRDEEVEQVVVRTLENTPRGATHWSTRTMAAAVGISETSVRRIWRAHGLNPRLMQTADVTQVKSNAAEIRWRNRPNGSTGEATASP